MLALFIAGVALLSRRSGAKEDVGLAEAQADQQTWRMPPLGGWGGDSSP
jgi:hypothetical protein